MTEEQRNYGVEPEPGGRGRSEPDGSRLRSTHTNSTISPSDEDVVGLAHLSVFLNLFTGFLGPVAALVIWLMYKDKSSRVSFPPCSPCGTSSPGW